MVIGIVIGFLLGTAAILGWQRVCCGIDEAYERLTEGEE